MADDAYFSPVLQGDKGALKRALYKSMGFTNEQLRRPMIAIVNSYTNATPGHCNLNQVAEKVKEGIFMAGGTAVEFSTIAPCDGMAEGHIGMRYILPAREVITDSIEVMVRAHRFDGMVLIGSCDKIVPGMLMAAARLGIPAAFINGGPMYPACYQGKHWDGNIVTEAIGWKNRALISADELDQIEDLAEPGAGSCTMLGTANTMGCLAEALGMALPGAAATPAVHGKRLRLAVDTGRLVVDLVKNEINSTQIITPEAIENAMTVLLAIGGSTNAIMHLQAIHAEAGLGLLPLEAFDRLSKKTPHIAAVYPASAYDMVDFFEAGGVEAVMKELSGLLHLDVLTINGKTLRENMDNFTAASNRNVIRELIRPFHPEGGVAILKGNLAPDGCVVKPAAILAHLFMFRGKARVFDSEEAAITSILDKQIEAGTVLVLRYEGPKGGPGMPEMYQPMKLLEGMDLAESCALITDGRFSGSNRGLFVGHISPEALEGSVLALVQDGDEIVIDIHRRSISLAVDAQELDQRKLAWQPVHKSVPRGYLNIYRRSSESASKGAVRK